ncbi:MAG: hypothetical protein ACLQUY_25200, partial [Ktedonobacterales bacterium]
AAIPAAAPVIRGRSGYLPLTRVGGVVCLVDSLLNVFDFLVVRWRPAGIVRKGVEILSTQECLVLIRRAPPRLLLAEAASGLGRMFRSVTGDVDWEP